MPGSSPDSNALENFEFERAAVLYHDPRYRSGGPGKITGSAAFRLHTQTRTPNQYVSVSATSTLYSAAPANGSNSRMKAMQAWAGGQDSTELFKWEPAYEKNYGATSTTDIRAELKYKLVKFSISKSWTRHEGVAGGMNDSGLHVMTWKHANKKGTAQSRGVTGVQIYQTPKGKATSIGIGAALTYSG